VSASHFQVSFYSPQAFLRASGDDVFGFLQGQFTNQLQVPIGSAVYGLWLNQKGKVLADSAVLRAGENEFYLVSVGSSGEVIRERLDAYIIADDVTLELETEKVGGIAVIGDGCGAKVEALLGARPESGRFVHANGVWAFPGRRVAGENYELIGPIATMQNYAQQMVAEGAVMISVSELEALRIEAAIPSVPQDIGMNDLPNEGALETVAISYTKGCYLGQEVMARLKNLGQVRRKLHALHGSGEAPAPGSPLYQGAEKVGEVRSVANRNGGFVAMAMLSLVKWDKSRGMSLQLDGEPSVEVIHHG
jgi:folate-binding protein YgfZ